MEHIPQLQRRIEATSKRSELAVLLGQWRWLALFVLLPTMLATLYYGVISADIYVSESRFVIKAPERTRSSGSAIDGLLQSTGLGSGTEQASEIIGYLRSRNALSDLSQKINVRAAFGSSEADILSRFPLLYQSNSFEDLYEYYGSMVTAQTDSETGLTVLSVSAFTPQEAQVLNAGLLNLSEELVNRLNTRVNSQAIAEAQARVDVAQERVRDARIKLGSYRNSSQLLDPQQQGIGVLEVSNALIAQEAALRAQLSEIRRNAPNHPSIPALQDRIAGLAQQVAEQTGRAVGTPDGIAAKITEYENLLVEQEFAEQTLTAANAALEQARVEAQQQQYYLERVVEPNQPDDAIKPARLRGILAVLFGTLCLYLVGWMLSVGIREHASED
ncbi:capsule biosynthesis protein [Erythrobacter sanguineus]|uniref:Capsular polysaccharide transport system permease protein n=1 Tax=Erythrobacter sanguineus TaxID=198312 RepID=A0A1M7T2F3_9SPHN|nr:capsule biosynthesis protein [Erythrobacter sanguineus]SHN64935.1 capsular polysaccharide transport system permease protein [Erythrobacter sanguineus]